MSVAVYEKDATAAIRNQGYRIRINADGITALRHVLTPRSFELFSATAGRPGPAMDTFDHQLNLRHSHKLPLVADLSDEGNLAVNRVTLREILLSGLEDAVHFGAQLTHYTTEPTGTITAHFANGRTATGDVLVGADGVNSATRRQHLPEAEVMEGVCRKRWGSVERADSYDYRRC